MVLEYGRSLIVVQIVDDFGQTALLPSLPSELDEVTLRTAVQNQTETTRRGGSTNTRFTWNPAILTRQDQSPVGFYQIRHNLSRMQEVAKNGLICLRRSRTRSTTLIPQYARQDSNLRPTV